MNKCQQILFTVLVLLPLSCFSQVEPLGPIVLNDTQRYSLYSETIDQTFRIDVSVPSSYQNSNDSYPVVYMLDSDSMFHFVFGNSRSLQALGFVPEFILVGIGYETEDPRGYQGLRYRDYTPTIDEEQTRIYKSRPYPFGMPQEFSTGGGEKFYQFIESELKQFLNSQYRTNSADETLMGYSLGGLFTTYVLFNHTSSFDRYIAGSPSIWYDDDVTFEFESLYASSHQDLDADVFMSVGSQETPDTMLGKIQEMAAILNDRNYPNFNFEFTLFNGENHISGMGVAMNRGLLSVFGNTIRN